MYCLAPTDESINNQSANTHHTVQSGNSLDSRADSPKESDINQGPYGDLEEEDTGEDDRFR